MEVVVGILVGLAVLAAAWALVRMRRAERTPEAIGMQSALHTALGGDGPADRPGETGRNPDHLLSLGRAAEPRRAPSRAGGGEPCVRTGRAVGDGRAGGADRAGRVARAPGSDLPALHLQ